ncbi:FkbM family methyltransferase [Gemmata sp. G18]|uniref:FkbM family methyltransferase n=1 Tax=Gemmata palustris TaxID=2822762 RepID=A0ABS5C1K3_9BACT|nr:FkbM family methyltransferase [Gemmata palustris]MBP3959330.1 FkbM family methyltransferase [Gemmata palustris]
MSALVQAYQSLVPAFVRGPLYHWRAWAAALVTSPAARGEWIAKRLVSCGRAVRTVRVPHGRLWVDLRDFGVGRRIFIHGRYEEPEAAVLRAVLQPGMTYLDVGGNLGYLATLAAKLVGETGRIIAIEPEPYNFALLQKNLKLNARERSTAVNVAAGGAPGTAKLFKSVGNLGDHRLYTDGDSSGRAFVEVPVVRLDDLFAANNWPAPDFIKIDVQGYEPHVVAGLDGLIRTNRPRAILTEYWPIGIRNAGGDPAAYLEWFRARGFECSLIGADCGLTPVAVERVDDHLPPLNPAVPDAQMLNLLFRR